MFSEKFICATDKICDYDNFVNAPLFRKTFFLEKLPDNVNFTICGLGLYELFINGKKITKGALAPYINNPDDILYYDSYDISSYLNKGENLIGIMLGNGFFNCFGGERWNLNECKCKGPLRVAFVLELSDGENKEIIEADTSVKVCDSPILLDDLRIGTFYDANLEQDGWNNIGFDDSNWKNAEFTDCPKGEKRITLAEPVKFYKELKPISIKYLDDFCYVCEAQAKYEKPILRTRVKDTYVYDFGENNSGVCKLKIKGEKGQKVILRFGEDMFDGKFSLRSTLNMGDYTDKDLDFPQMDIYILKGEGEEKFIPPFTYHGFRYVLVEGITEKQATNELLSYMVMSSSMEQRGFFECSDERINKLFDMTLRADRSNIVYIPTDCPHREKNGWTADIALSSEHMLINYNLENSFAEWLRSVVKAQRESGELPGIIPTAGWGFDWGNGPLWDSVCVYLPYYCYKYSGKTHIISENIDMIFKYLCYIDSKRDQRGLIEIGLEDWSQPNFESKETLAPILFTDSAMVYDLAKKAAFLAEVIGETELAKKAETLADSMRAAIRKHLIDFSDMTAMGNCQTSQSFAIAIGLFEENEIQKAVEKLVEFVHNKNDHLFCGVLGARFIFRILADYGYADLAYKMLTAEGYPSYMQWVKAGDTALREAFAREGYGDRFQRDSKNHHFWGDISAFFVMYLAGLKINPHNRDICEVEVSPSFIKELDFARAFYNTKWGKIETSWKRIEEKIELDVIKPEEVYGKIILPKGFAFENGENTGELKSGKYIICAI